MMRNTHQTQQTHQAQQAERAGQARQDRRGPARAKLNTYIIAPRGDAHFEHFSVRANGYDGAALVAARRLNPHTRAVFIRRVTGVPGLSGVYQAYEPLGHEGGATSVGGNMHVMEVS